jgi:cell wall-associated NlpC family hydrolase
MISKRFASLLTILGIILVFSVCTTQASIYRAQQTKHKHHVTQQTGKIRATTKKVKVTGKIKTTNVLKEYFAKWEGTRYRKGGLSHQGVDCSGFTFLTYKQIFGRDLPRTSVEQAQSGTKIARNALLPGDLVFFKRGVYGKHVGIYLENGKFIHASTSKGVMISSLDDSYWRNKYWTAARY